ncbi:MAG: adenylosuccinate synthetase, partial [Candidatus Aminicenantes bacterium]|nr:adenylosuccinate synthetase [Candidatus Aminicenantes bacterium]
LLDINFGTFPFVTSSNPTVGGMFTGTGLPHKSLDTITGISKAYTTRVGGGPFPSELKGDTGEYLRKQGNEYGSTTGRPRRVGWLDLVALKYAVMVNGVDDIFLTKLDVLDELEEIEMVTGYQTDGDISTIFEPDHIYLDNVTPVLKKFRGWRSDTSGIKVYKDLPEEAKEYIRFIEEFSEIPVRTVSVGVSSEQTIKNCKE